MNWESRKSQMSASAPKRCSCGGKLSHIVYERKTLSLGNRVIEYGNGQFRKRCTSCPLYYEWSYPNVWIEHSELPLWDTKRVLPQLFDFYGDKA